MEGAHRDIFRHGEQLSETHGAALAAWARGEMPAPTGSADVDHRPQFGRERLMAAARKAAAEGTAALRDFRGTLDERQDGPRRPILAEIETMAVAVDAGSDLPGDWLAERMAA